MKKTIENLVKELERREIFFHLDEDNKVLMEYDMNIDDEYSHDIDIYTYDIAGYCELCNKIRLLEQLHNFDTGEIFCHECIKDNEQATREVIEETINTSTKAITFIEDNALEEEGFRKYDNKEYQVSFHDVTQHHPNDLLTSLQKQNKKGTEFIFKITNHNAFTTEYEVWVRYNKNEEANEYYM